jgi:hypothetical protein
LTGRRTTSTSCTPGFGLYVDLEATAKSPAGPVLRFAPGNWSAWLHGATKGKFDRLGS